MFQNLTQRLSRAVQQMTGRGRITEDNVRDTVRQIRMALLEADVAVPVVKALIERVRERALGEEVANSLNPGQVFTKIVHDELVTVLGGEDSALVQKGKPAVTMLVGLQGAGKTTTAAKLAYHLSKGAGRRVLLTSTDVYRPAAREQLRTLAHEHGFDYFDSEENSAVAIARGALEAASSRGSRWLIVDTAGRVHVDKQMMNEARALHAAIAPEETLFVVDAMAGQDAVNSARAFQEALPMTGVVLTKADGDARGGAALSVREVTGLPIKMIGTGEKVEALEPFVPRRMASRILGMGDVAGLVEAVQRQVDVKSAERVAAKVKRGRALDLTDFRGQLQQLVKMGGVGSLLDKLPGVDASAAQANFDERQIRRQMGIIDSMTPRERRQPKLIDGSRKRRIAVGAGLSVQDVNRLLKQHRQIAKTMKRVKKGGLEGLLGGGALPPGPRSRPGRRTHRRR